MIKKLQVLFLMLAAILLTDCAAHKRAAYIYPDNIPKSDREQLFVIYEKGRILYEHSCARCHSIHSDDGNKMPDFSVRQIDGYTTRFLKGDPKNHAVAAKMDPEQLNSVFQFLRFRKINGAPAVLIPDKNKTAMSGK